MPGVTYDAETYCPTEIYQGEYRRWQHQWADYPTTDWTLRYTFRGPSSLTVTATVTGQSFDVVLNTTQTSALEPGDYVWQADVRTSTFRRTLMEGELTVHRDLAAVSTDFHTVNIGNDLTHAYTEVTSLLRDGSQMSRMAAEGGLTEIYQLARNLRWDYLREQDRQKRIRGEETSRSVGVRFKAE